MERATKSICTSIIKHSICKVTTAKIPNTSIIFQDISKSRPRETSEEPSINSRQYRPKIRKTERRTWPDACGSSRIVPQVPGALQLTVAGHHVDSATQFGPKAPCARSNKLERKQIADFLTQPSAATGRRFEAISACFIRVDFFLVTNLRHITSPVRLGSDRRDRYRHPSNFRTLEAWG